MKTATVLPPLFEFNPHLTPDFQLELVAAGLEVWVVRCRGLLELPNAASLVQPELIRLHEAALKAGIKRVELEVQDVEYMNSSGLKSFMAWFLTAANTPGAPYLIEVRLHPGRSWQHLSFRPMERLAPQTVRLRSSLEEAG